MALFTPAWKTENKEKALSWVAKCGKQAVLERVAIEAPLDETRLAAVDMLSSNESLGRILLDEKFYCRGRELTQRAVERVTDDRTLAALAENHPDERVRLFSLGRIKDQRLYAETAVGFSDPLIRLKAAGLLEDQKKLSELALNDTDAGVRAQAAKRLSDQEKLCEIALNDKDANVRSEAAKRVTDQDFLLRIAINEKDEAVRLDAIERLEYPTLLKTLNMDPISLELKAALLKRTDDPEVRRRIMTTLIHDDFCRFYPLVKDPKERIKYLTESKNFSFIGVHKANLGYFENDNRALELIACKSPNRNIRVAAMDQMTDPDAITRAMIQLKPCKIGKELTPERFTNECDHFKYAVNYSKSDLTKSVAAKVFFTENEKMKAKIREKVISYGSEASDRLSVADAMDYITRSEKIEADDIIAKPLMAKAAYYESIRDSLAKKSSPLVYKQLMELAESDELKALDLLTYYPVPQTVKLLTEIMTSRAMSKPNLAGRASNALIKIYRGSPDTAVRDLIEAIPQKKYQPHTDAGGVFCHDDYPEVTFFLDD